MSDLLDSPVLVLTDLDDAGAPAPGALELLTAASHLTGSGVVALALAEDRKSTRLNSSHP